jgi:hypothetical protein
MDRLECVELNRDYCILSDFFLFSNDSCKCLITFDEFFRSDVIRTVLPTQEEPGMQLNLTFGFAVARVVSCRTILIEETLCFGIEPYHSVTFSWDLTYSEAYLAIYYLELRQNKTKRQDSRLPDLVSLASLYAFCSSHGKCRIGI